MSSFLDLIAPDSVTNIRAKIIGYAQAAGLDITSWQVQDVGQQTLEYVVNAVNAYTEIIAEVVRGFASLDTSTDPGDVDPYNEENASYEPSSGYLSAFGANVFGTVRPDATFAAGFATLVNASGVPQTIFPGGLVYTWTEGTPPSPAPTYTNTEDDTIYTNPDGSITIAPGGTATLPVRCDTIGASGTCPASALSLTTTIIGCSGTNAAPIQGQDRQPADAYRSACRAAASRLSFAGPASAYLYFATSQLDGTPLLNASGAAVGITTVQVTQSPTTGIVRCFYGSPSGPASAEDVTAANTNIVANAVVVPGAITFIGAACTATTINVAGSASITSASLGSATIADVRAAIVAAFVAASATTPIGGSSRNASGSGSVFVNDLEEIVYGAFRGLYRVTVSSPSGDQTIAAGAKPVYSTTGTDWTITVVSE